MFGSFTEPFACRRVLVVPLYSTPEDMMTGWQEWQLAWKEPSVGNPERFFLGRPWENPALTGVNSVSMIEVSGDLNKAERATEWLMLMTLLLRLKVSTSTAVLRIFRLTVPDFWNCRGKTALCQNRSCRSRLKSMLGCGAERSVWCWCLCYQVACSSAGDVQHTRRPGPEVGATAQVAAGDDSIFHHHHPPCRSELRPRYIIVAAADAAAGPGVCTSTSAQTRRVLRPVTGRPSGIQLDEGLCSHRQPSERCGPDWRTALV